MKRRAEVRVCAPRISVRVLPWVQESGGREGGSEKSERVWGVTYMGSHGPHDYSHSAHTHFCDDMRRQWWTKFSMPRYSTCRATRKSHLRLHYVPFDLSPMASLPRGIALHFPMFWIWLGDMLAADQATALRVPRRSVPLRLKARRESRGICAHCSRPSLHLISGASDILTAS